MADIHTLDAQGHRDDELLSRYLDGELGSDEREALTARLSAEPALAQRLEQFRNSDAVLRALHDTKPESVSPFLVARLSSHTAKTGFLAANRYLLAAAASVTLAIGIAFQFTPAEQGATPGMDPALASALETLPSRAEGWDNLNDGRDIRAVLTFPAADGAWCREFMLASEENHWRGVACRHDGSWVTQVVGREVFLEQEAAYRPAGAGDTNTVSGYIDDTAAGIALSRDQEKQLIDQGWPSP